MATLSDIIKKKRSSGQSRTSSLFGSLKDKLKESIDPRQLINQTGLLTALFPSLKAYKADSKITENISKKDVKFEAKNALVEKINRNTSIFAKNTMSLQSIGRDINVARRNVTKLVEITGAKPSDKTDIFFQKSEESEKLYESQVKKLGDKKTATNVTQKQKKKSFNWLNMLGIVGGVGVIYLIVDFFNRKEKSIISELHDSLGDTIDNFKEIVSSNIESTMTNISSDINELMTSITNKTSDLQKDFSDTFSIENIEELFKSDKSIGSKFEEHVDKFKTSLSEHISNFSIIPTAQASTLPSLMQSSTKPGLSGMTGREEEAMNFFMSKGWTKEQSAGIVGNLVQESNLNPEAYNKKENAQGIAQWRNGRVQRFEQMHGKSVRSASFREQLEFVNWELNNTHKSAGDALKKTKTTEQATSVIDKQYEISAGTELSTRIANANNLLNSSNKIESNGPIKISSRFGSRTHPKTGQKDTMHHGVDVSAPNGAPIYAVAGGVITSIGSQNGYGNTIIIDHGNGTTSLYAHQSGFADGLVVGSKITKGQLIGFVGSTGVSTGPHLHFELRQNGKAINPGDDMAMSALVKTLASLDLTEKNNSSSLENMSRLEQGVQQVATNTIITPVEKIVYVGVDNSMNNKKNVGIKYLDNMIEMVT